LELVGVTAGLPFTIKRLLHCRWMTDWNNVIQITGYTRDILPTKFYFDTVCTFSL